MSTNQLCHQVVKSDVLKPNDEEIRTIMNKLTDEELEYVAQSSYAYWHACETGEITDRDETRHGMALREVERYCDAANKDQELTFEALKRNCQYRQEYRIDVLLSCFDESVDYKDTKDTELASDYRTTISKDLAKQPMVVKAGATGRGVLNLGARCCTDMHEEAFLLNVIYMIERAVAATESLSNGRETQMDVVVNASGFKFKYAPSLSTLKILADILQNQYPQRLNSLVILDPPLWLSTIYSLFSACVDERTRSKFQLARGSKAQKSVLGEILKFPVEEVETDAIQIEATVPFQSTVDTFQQSSRLLSQ